VILASTAPDGDIFWVCQEGYLRPRSIQLNPACHIAAQILLLGAFVSGWVSNLKTGVLLTSRASVISIRISSVASVSLVRRIGTPETA
jgi:hypothetical protein